MQAKTDTLNIALLLILPLIPFIWNNLDPSPQLHSLILYSALTQCCPALHLVPLTNSVSTKSNYHHNLLSSFSEHAGVCVVQFCVRLCMCVCKCTSKCVLILHDSTWLTSHWSNYLRPKTPYSRSLHPPLTSSTSPMFPCECPPSPFPDQAAPMAASLQTWSQVSWRHQEAYQALNINELF